MELQVADATHPSATANALVTWLSRDEGPLLVAAQPSEGLILRTQRALSRQCSDTSGQYHCLILLTSGSTGRPKLVPLSSSALRASASATEMRLGSPGLWITALPLQHIAGVQTVVRSVLAGFTPYLALDAHFDPSALAAAIQDARLRHQNASIYLSLVSAQLSRCLKNPAVVAELASTEAILLGGGRIPSELLEAAQREGLNVVTTYGMTETSGGCVYDGQPLSGCRVKLDASGTVLLAGSTLTSGYLDSPTPWVVEDHTRWFRTADLGEIGEDGLSVLGRHDDIVNSGGEKISTEQVRAALEKVPGVFGAYVYGRDSGEWGQEVVAALELDGGHHWSAELGASLTAAVAGEVGRAAVPRVFVLTNPIPRTSLGKVDRPSATAHVEVLISQGKYFRR